MFKLLVPVAVLVAVLLAAVLIDRPLPRADFVYIERSEVTTLDQHKASWMHDLRMATNIYEGLVRYDNFTADYRKKPATAESWTVSEDGRTWTFTIRAGAKWSDGQPVKASDFVYSYRRGMLPDMAGDYISMFQLIKGGKAFYDWRAKAQSEFAAESKGRARPAEAEALWKQTLAKFDELVGLKAPDDRTLVMELERPVPYLLEVLAYEVMGPVYPPLVDRFQSIDPTTGMVKYDSGWTKPGVLIGNGPFVLEDWRYKREIRLRKNEHYWDAKNIHFNTISMPSVPDGNAAVLAFQTGAADWLTDVNVAFRGDLVARREAYLEKHKDLVEKLKAQGLDRVEIDRRLPRDEALFLQPMDSFGTYFINFNCLARLPDGRTNPLSDARVRRALVMAMDRSNITKNVRRAGEEPATTLIPPRSIGGYESPKGLPCAPDPQAIAQAKQLLADAGYPQGQGLPTLVFLFNKEGGHDLIAQAIKQDWEQNLGVSVSLEQVEIKVFREKLKNGDYMISRGSWFGDYGDPLTFLDLNRTNDGNNDRKYSSARFDALLDEANSQRDPAERMRILSQAERVLMEEDLPLAPVFHYKLLYLFDPWKVSGITPHPRQKQYPFQMNILGDELVPDVPMLMRPALKQGAGGTP